MTGGDLTPVVLDAEASFDASLCPGLWVTAWWTDGPRCRSAPAVVLEVRAKTVKLELQRAMGELAPGYLLELPRYGQPGWNFSHGARSLAESFPGLVGKNALACPTLAETKDSMEMKR